MLKQTVALTALVQSIVLAFYAKAIVDLINASNWVGIAVLLFSIPVITSAYKIINRNSTIASLDGQEAKRLEAFNKRPGVAGEEDE